MLLPRRIVWIAWLVVGLVIAAGRDYLDGVSTVGELLSALLAIVLWPLLLLGVDLHVHL